MKGRYKHCDGHKPKILSSVRLLESSSGTFTTELFRLTTSGVRDEETLVVLKKKFFKLSFGGLVVILLIESNNTLSDSHTDCHNLVHGTTTRYANTDAEVLEAVSTKNEDRFINLKAHGFGFNEV